MTHKSHPFAPHSWIRTTLGTLSHLLLLLSLLASLLACGGDQPPAPSATVRSAGGVASAAEADTADGDRSPRLPVHHLLQLFPTAATDTEVASLQLGSPAARAHLLTGWGLDERDDVRSYVWGLGPVSTFELFSSDTYDAELVLHGRAFTYPGASPQTVEVLVNGQSVGQVEIGQDFERLRLAVPASRLRVGRNRFELRYGRHDVPSEIFPGAVDDRSLAVLWYSLTLEGALDAAAPSQQGELLRLPVGSRVSYFEDLRPGDELVLGHVESSNGAVALSVELETADGTVTWSPNDAAGAGGDGSDDAAGPSRWALPIETPQLARLSLIGGRADGGLWDRLTGWFGGGPAVTVLLPMVMRPAAAVDEASDAPSDAKSAPERAIPPAEDGSPDMDVPPDIIVYLIDTLRADRLGTYGYDRPISPRIDQFAAGATVFTRAQAQSSWTRTAVTSLFTGMLPQAHGVNRRDEALAPQITTLAEALKEQGYETVGFITNGNVDAAFGLDQGFDHYQYLRESEDNVFFHQTAERLHSWVFKWLDTLAPRGQRPPFFLYVHATDPHAPYTPSDEYYERFAAGVERQRGWLEHVHDISAGRLEAPPGTAEAWSDLYDAEIAYTDHHFGRLLDRLRGQGIDASSLIVLLSDHGEEFFEHGGWEHGKTLYGEQLRVPLIVHLPAGQGAGQRLPILANQMDVLPTVLDYLGAEPPDLVQGQSLLPWMRGTSTEGKDASFAYLRLGARHQHSVIDRDFKLIVDAAQRPHGHELFDIAADMDETRDLASQDRLEEGYLDQTLRRLEAGLRRRGAASSTRVEVDEELRRRLEALGYVDN